MPLRSIPQVADIVAVLYSFMTRIPYERASATVEISGLVPVCVHFPALSHLDVLVRDSGLRNYAPNVVGDCSIYSFCIYRSHP